MACSSELWPCSAQHREQLTGICPEFHSQYKTRFVVSVASKRGRTQESWALVKTTTTTIMEEERTVSKCVSSLRLLCLQKLPSDESVYLGTAQLLPFWLSGSDIPKERWVVSSTRITTLSLQNTATGYPPSPSPDTLEQRYPGSLPTACHPGC